jgi:hypothetical protein
MEKGKIICSITDIDSVPKIIATIFSDGFRDISAETKHQMSGQNGSAEVAAMIINEADI